jgi:hypothetical protein
MIARGTTEKDMHDLTSIDILQTYGNDHSLIDNPWAVATVEKMKGTYLSARAKDEYNTFRQSQEPAKTAEEEVTRYNKFTQDYFGKAAEKASDITAFKTGYFENHPADQAEFAGRRLQELEVERKGIAQGSVQASLGTVISKSPTLSGEDLTKAVSDVFADTRMLGFSIPEKAKLAKEAMIDLAQSDPDFEKIKTMSEKVVIGAKPDGTLVHLGEVVNLHDVQQLAEQRTTQLFGVKVQTSLEELQGMTKEEANAKFAEWQVNDPHWFNVMSPYRDNVYRYQVEQEKKKLAAAFAASEQSYIKEQSVGILRNQFKAYLAGSNKDASNKVVAASYGDLPKITYSHRNSQGILVEKTKDWSVEEVNSFVDDRLNEIMGNPNLDSGQKTAQAMKLLSWGPAKHYTDSVKMQLNNAIDTITVDKLPTGEDGKARLSDQLQTAVQMYNTNPEDFHNMMGDDVTKKLETIQLLSQANGGDMRAAVGLYAQGRERAKDKEFTKNMDAAILGYLGGGTLASLAGFMDLQGNEVKANVSLASNRSVMERVEGLAKWLVYSGVDPAEAVQSAKAAAQKTHYIWKDTAIPRSIFNGINSSQRVKVGQQVLDYYFDKFVSDTGVDPQHIITTFDNTRGVFRLTGGGGYAAYTLNDIAYSGNYILSQAEASQGVSLEEARRLQQGKIGLPNPENGPKGLNTKSLSNMQKNWEKNTGISQPSGGIQFEIPSPDGLSISEVDNTNMKDDADAASPSLWKILRYKASGNNPYYDPSK